MNPFDCEYRGLLVVCLIPNSSQKLLYADWYWGPLSDMTSLGTPSKANVSLVAAMMLEDVVEVTFLITGYQLK